MPDTYSTIHHAVKVELQNGKAITGSNTWTHFRFYNKKGDCIHSLTAHDCPEIIRLEDKS